LIRIHRENPVRRPTIFNISYTSIGVHISHAERCGCSNATVFLKANEPLPFTSPDWPVHYCDILMCVTTYVAPTHHHVEVKVST
ncbi:hypothetical protein PMAYCL1PPCAC_01830, partial [Pristionchus mayeri]